MKAMTALGQLLHRKLFKPVQREVEGRKDLEKRLADRKKVRLDYDAYRRKQQHLIQTDPDNARTYEANLENARQTFSKHSALVDGNQIYLAWDWNPDPPLNSQPGPHPIAPQDNIHCNDCMFHTKTRSYEISQIIRWLEN